MSTFDDMIAQAYHMRDKMVAAATRRADRWLDETLAILNGLPERPVTSLPNDANKAETDDNDETRSTMTLPEQIRNALAARSHHKFSTADLRHDIERQNTYRMSPSQRANLSKHLTRMVTEDALVLVSEGKGSRPAFYRKKTQEQAKGNTTEEPSTE